MIDLTMKAGQRALIFDIKRDCSEDGPGIRTTVFFKGCPMACSWCQNPEGISFTPEISFNVESCNPSVCNMPCIAACAQNCIHYDYSIGVNFNNCNRCNACFSQCGAKALQPVGYFVDVDQLLDKVLVDEAFFHSSGGGVTLSGGEATAQPEFIHIFLKKLKKKGINTALETCGLFNYQYFAKKILPYLDILYFDLKLYDENESQHYTGVSNKPIFNNFSRLIKNAHIPVIPRIPLIPNITATNYNLKNLSNFLRRLGAQSCVLIPFNPLYKEKLSKLGKTTGYTFPGYLNQKEQQTCINNFYYN